VIVDLSTLTSPAPAADVDGPTERASSGIAKGTVPGVVAAAAWGIEESWGTEKIKHVPLVESTLVTEKIATSLAMLLFVAVGLAIAGAILVVVRNFELTATTIYGASIAVAATTWLMLAVARHRPPMAPIGAGILCNGLLLLELGSELGTTAGAGSVLIALLLLVAGRRS